jgi:hypothetical protein
MKHEGLLDKIGREETPDDLLDKISAPSLQPLIDAADVIPEEERIQPYISKTAIERLFGTFISPDVPIPGLQAGQPAPVYRLAEITGRPVSEITEEISASTIPGIFMGLRVAGAAELFFQGALSYYLETEPARLGRKAFRAIPPYIKYGPIKGKEPTKPFSFRNMIDWGVKAVTGTSPEVEQHAQWSKVFERLGKTQEEIELTNQWFERHKGMKRARQVSDIATELAVGVAFEVALGYGVAKAGGVLKNFFSTAKPGILRRGFRDAVIAQMDEFDVARKGIPFVGGVSMEDIRKGLNITDIDEFSANTLYRSYIDQVQKSKLVPKEYVDNVISAASYGKAKDTSMLNRLQLEQVVNDIGVYMDAPASAKPVINLVDQTFRPKWDVFHKLDLFDYYTNVEDGRFMVSKIVDDSQAFYSSMRKSYYDDFGIKWDVPERMTAWYLAQKKSLPKEFRDQLMMKSGQDLDKYSDMITFIEDFVAEDKLRYFDVLRDEAVRQGRIGPGTDIPIVNYYVYNISEDAAKKRLKGTRTKYSPGTPKDMWAPEFLKRQRKVPDEILMRDYEVTRWLALRDESRKLYIQPELDRFDAIIAGRVADLPEADGKLLQDFYDNWKKFNVFSHPTRSDTILNAQLNRLSNAIEKSTGGRWQATGRSWENFTGHWRQSIARGTLLGNARPVVRNTFQGLLSIPLIGSKATVAGYSSMFTRGGRGILNDLDFTVGRGPRGRKILFSAVDITNTKSWDSMLTYGGIAAVDKYMNTAAAVNGYLWKEITGSRRKMQELIEFGAMIGAREQMVKGAGFWDTLQQAIRMGKFKNEVDGARKLLYHTQWNYNRMGAPAYMTSALGRMLGQYTTWPAHFTTTYIRQLFAQGLGKETIFGLKPSVNERLALFKYVAMVACVAEVGRRMGVNTDFMWKGLFPAGRIYGQEVPFPVSPSLETVIGVGAVVGGTFKGLANVALGSMENNNKMLDQGISMLSKSGLANVIPGYTGGKRLYEVMEGEREPYELLWTPTAEEKRARSPLEPSRPTRPKY